MTRHAAAILLAGAAVLATLPLSGCARARERWQARFNPPEPEPAGLIEPDPADLAPAEQGLEVIVWTADDTDHRVARALFAHALPEPPLAPADNERWRAAGFRVVAVPPGRLDAVLSAAPPITPLQRQRYAQIPRWTPLVRGPRIPAGLPAPGAYDASLPAGRPRLIARSWIEPRIADARVEDTVRTELLLQIETGSNPSITAGPAERSVADAGPVLEDLLASLISDGSAAFVIVADAPGTDWSDLPPPPKPPTQPTDAEPPPPGEPEAGTEPEADATADPNAPDAPGGQNAASPTAPPTPRTLGERMLAAPAVPADRGRPATPPRKVLLVLVPRLLPGPDTPPVSARGTP